MGHVPHVYVPGPWPAASIALAAGTRHHLDRVLRRENDTPLSYTDGAGTVGRGTYREGVVERGDEHKVARGPEVDIVVAPPRATERVRFLIEKLAELGVHRLRWLATVHGEGRPPKPEKASAWAAAALQQSRGAYLLQIDGPVRIDALAGDDYMVADQTGRSMAEVIGVATRATVVIGPEAGFAPDEVSPRVACVSVAPTVLRVETAAVIAAGLALDVLRSPE